MLQADGGTRTAAITGAYVALADAVTYLSAAGKLSDPRPLSCAIAAVSVGVVDGRIRVDLPYEEDSRAEVDMNVVATDTGTLVEIQGTGEGATFPRSTLDKLLDAALGSLRQIVRGPARGAGSAVSGCAARGAAADEGVRQLTDERADRDPWANLGNVKTPGKYPSAGVFRGEPLMGRTQFAVGAALLVGALLVTAPGAGAAPELPSYIP